MFAPAPVCEQSPGAGTPVCPYAISSYSEVQLQPHHNAPRVGGTRVRAKERVDLIAGVVKVAGRIHARAWCVVKGVDTSNRDCKRSLRRLAARRAAHESAN